LQFHSNILPMCLIKVNNVYEVSVHKSKQLNGKPNITMP
jgi:hypothetical protein